LGEYGGDDRLLGIGEWVGVAGIAAYYLPWLDNALDIIAAPLAVAAGTILTESQIHDASPYLQSA